MQNSKLWGVALVAALGAGACGSGDAAETPAVGKDPASVEVEELAAEQAAFADESREPEDDVDDDPLPPEDEAVPEQADDAEGAADPLPDPSDPIFASEDGPEVEDVEPAALAPFAAGPRKMFGLGVDTPKAIDSSLFADFRARWVQGDYKLGGARNVIYLRDPWSGNVHPVVEHVSWVQKVKSAGLEPFLSLYVNNGPEREAMKSSQFRGWFASMLRIAPDVKYWGINEPDIALKGAKYPRQKSAKFGVRYLTHAVQVLRRCRANFQGDYGDAIAAACKGMRLVAGEFAYEGGKPENSHEYWGFYRGYLKQSVEKTKSIRRSEIPRIWSLHPYIDVSTGKTSASRKFMGYASRSQRQLRMPSGSFRVWLTEVGTLLRLSGSCTFSQGNINGDNAQQYRGAKSVFSLTKLRGVDRIYWWQFQASAGHPWNSALVASDGVTKYPGYYGMTHQPLPSIPKVCADGCTQYCQ